MSFENMASKTSMVEGGKHPHMDLRVKWSSFPPRMPSSAISLLLTVTVDCCYKRMYSQNILVAEDLSLSITFWSHSKDLFRGFCQLIKICQLDHII